MSEQKVAMIEVSRIRANPAALRDVVMNSEGFLGLCESVKRDGVLNAISVRELPDPDAPGQIVFGLVDGLHRFTAAKQVGLTTIPAVITGLDDGAVEEAQIIANIHRIETKPVEYSKGLLRILKRNPLMTEAELSEKLSKSPTWLKERLNLVKLDDGLQELVDSGKVGLANAYQLAKLPPNEQKEYADRAQTMQPAQFIPLVTARAKELREAAKQGREAAGHTFTPVAHLRKISEINGEIEAEQMAKVLTSKLGITSAAAAFTLALKWAVHMDPDSVEVQRAEDEARTKAREEAKAKAEAERKAKKLAKAQEEVAALT